MSTLNNNEVLQGGSLQSARQELLVKYNQVDVATLPTNIKGLYQGIKAQLEQLSFNEVQKNLLLHSFNAIQFHIKQGDFDRVKTNISQIQEFINSINSVETVSQTRTAGVSKDSLITKLESEDRGINSAIIQYLNTINTGNSEVGEYYRKIFYAVNDSERINTFRELKEYIRSGASSASNSENVATYAPQNRPVNNVNTSNSLLSSRAQGILDELMDISIDGSADVDTYLEKLRSYESKIRLLNISEEEKRALISDLQAFSNEIHDGSKLGYGQIEDYFNNLAQNIVVEGNQFYVPLVDENGNQVKKYFATKEQALSFVKDLKSQAEDTFQKCITNIVEWIGGKLMTLDEGLLDIPVSLAMKTFGIERDDFIGWLGTVIMALITYATFSVYLGVHLGPLESVVRRVLVDNFQRLIKKYQIQDYGRSNVPTPTDMSTPEGKQFMEFKQRQQIENLLRGYIETKYSPGDPKYIKAVQELNRISTYKLNKTPTFFYLSYKFAKDKGFGHTLYSILFRGARFPLAYWKTADDSGNKKWLAWRNIKALGPLNDSQNLANKTLNTLLGETKTSVEGGLKLFYSRYSVTLDMTSIDIGKYINIDVKDGKKTDVYFHIIDYINAKDISQSEKRKIKEKFESYIEKLVDIPTSEKVIYRDLYSIIEKPDYGKSSDFSFELRTKLDSMSDIALGAWIRSKSRIPFTDFGTQYNRLKYFKELIDNGEWVGTKKEFDDEIKRIENKVSYRPKANYDSRLRSVDFEAEFNNIKGKGEVLMGKSKKSILFDIDMINRDTTKVDGDKTFKEKPSFEYSEKFQTDFTKNLFDYVNYGLKDNIFEKHANRKFEDLFDRILTGELIFTDETKLYMEIDRITKGNVASYEIIETLTELKEGNNTEKKKIIDAAKDGKYNLTPQELNDFKNNPASIVYESRKLNGSFDVDIFKSKIDKYKGWKSADFRGTLGISEGQRVNSQEYLNKLEDKFRTELDYLSILDRMTRVDTKKSIQKELQKFSEVLEKYNYSQGQASKILEEIFAGKKFKDIVNVDIKRVPNFYSGENDLRSRIQTEFDGLDYVQQTKLIQDINADSSIKNIPDFLEKNDKARIISELEYKIKNIANIDNSEDLMETKKEFDKYVSDEKINRHDSQYEPFMDRFENEYKGKLKDINSRGPSPIPHGPGNTDFQRVSNDIVTIADDLNRTKAIIEGLKKGDSTVERFFTSEETGLFTGKNNDEILIKLNKRLEELDVKQFDLILEKKQLGGKLSTDEAKFLNNFLAEHIFTIIELQKDLYDLSLNDKDVRNLKLEYLDTDNFSKHNIVNYATLISKIESRYNIEIQPMEKILELNMKSDILVDKLKFYEDFNLKKFNIKDFVKFVKKVKF